MTLTPSMQLDCRGMQCPEPILKTARAAREMGGGILEILADDDAFPLDLKSWAKSTKAEIKILEASGDGFRALVQVAGVRSLSLVGQKAANKSAQAIPSAPASPSEVIDCRGMQCPQPVVELAKRSRPFAPSSVFSVLADDDAFALDVKSWCRSSGATLVSLDEMPDGVMRATIRKSAAGAPAARVKASSTLGAVPTPFAMPPSSALALPSMPQPAAAPAMAGPNTGTLQLDMRGLSADEAVTRLSAAATLGDVAVELIALEALSAPLMQWCGTGGHQVTGLATGDGVLRTTLRLRHTLTPAVVAAGQENRCALLILNSDHEALLAAMLVANGAVAQGMEVVIFFSFWGLNLLRAQQPRADVPKEATSLPQKMFKWLMPAGPRRQKLSKHHFGGLGTGMLNKIMKDQKIMSLPELLDSASDMGAEYIACTMSMGVMGIQKRDLIDIPNLSFGGVAAFVEEAGRAKINMVF